MRVEKGQGATSGAALVTALSRLLLPALVGPMTATWAAPAFSGE
ncbi:MAG: hypothetical protein ACE5OO_05455 [Candidatus Bathyarchaeia archaeon]